MTPDDRKARYAEWAKDYGSKKGNGLDGGIPPYVSALTTGISNRYPDLIPDGCSGNLFELEDIPALEALLNELKKLKKTESQKRDYCAGLSSYIRFLKHEQGEEGALTADNSTFVDEMTALVERYGNVVFHGAPGTGKTYLAKQIAAKLITGSPDGKLEADDLRGRWGFVQFHPSYDYTDFVEGLRPVSAENGDVGFELRPGIFTEFIDGVRRANGGALSAQAIFDNAWRRFEEDISEREAITLTTARGIDHTLALTRSGVSLVDMDRIYLPRNRVFEWWMGEGVEWHRSYFISMVNLLKEQYELPEFDKDMLSTDDEASRKRYVFIIDEINRGDISKVFGELFFAIDPGYRGDEKSGVVTQYANLHDDSEYAFNDRFFIPGNVFIVATMNDIDRSVDSFDYAMRRRFRFVEVRACDTQSMLAVGDKPNGARALAAMTTLNRRIEQEDGLGARYEFGASYFLGYAAGKEEPEQLWKYSLEPLLKEYFHDAGIDENAIAAYKDSFDEAVSGERVSLEGQDEMRDEA